MTEPGLLTHVEPAMGTVFSLTVVPAEMGEEAAQHAILAACATLHRLDVILSTWDRQSPVSRFRRGEACLSELPTEVADVIELCRQAYQLSRGWFDPWAMPGGVDPTGLAKGWSVEQALAVLREAGLAAAMVNGGGDVAVFGLPAPGQGWRVGIRHPWRADALAGIVEVESAIATSACYERGPHLIDPVARLPASRAASATVVGPSLAIADALATAVAVGGEDALAAVGDADGYAGYLIGPDGTETATVGITFVS